MWNELRNAAQKHRAIIVIHCVALYSEALALGVLLSWFNHRC